MTKYNLLVFTYQFDLLKNCNWGYTHSEERCQGNFIIPKGHMRSNRARATPIILKPLISIIKFMIYSEL